MAGDKSIKKRLLTLRDGSPASLLPIWPSTPVAEPIMAAVMDIMNYEIEKGDTYPVEEPFTDVGEFRKFWCSYFCVILFAGDVDNLEDASLAPGVIGSFYVKPNYPGRCSHVCNAGFLVQPARRGLRIGSILGKEYLNISPRLGYEYSVFNLVFVTNLASISIWDGLGFDRIGLIKGAGRLKNHKERVDAIVYGKSLVPTAPSEEPTSHLAS